MIPSRSAIISTVATVLLLMWLSPERAFVVGAFFAPMPFFFAGLIIDRYPSKTAVLSSLVVILLHRFGVGNWTLLLAGIIIGSVVDVYFKMRAATKEKSE